MKLKTNILKSLGQYLVSLKYYDSIHNLPIENWFKYNELANNKLLVRNRFIPYWSEKVWDKIYDEFIKEIGLNDNFKDYLETHRRIAIMQCNWVIAPSPADKIRINQEIRDLEEKLKGETMKYNEIIAVISKSQGYRIDPKKVSVYEFYGYLKIAK